MGIDFSRVATSALQAALEDGHQPEAKQHHRWLTAGKAIVAGAAVAVAAKYAVDKASPLKRKAAMAAVRHTARDTLGDLVPESLHDKLMDSGFFDHDEDFDAPQGETKDLFDEAEGEESEESEDQEFFEEPEDQEGDEPEDEEPEKPDDVELDEPEDDEEPEAEEEEEEPQQEEAEPEAEEEEAEPEAEEDEEPEEQQEEEEDEKKPRRSRGRTRAKTK
jgi:hypothetical protein